MRYVLGLDIGIASVGWAVLNQDDKRVEALGVRAFNRAEHPKNGASLAAPRRLARSVRRRLRRRAGRLQRAKTLFVDYGLIAPQALDTAFDTAKGKPSPWELRAEGLDRMLNGEEFARALFHIVKRRGFKSNRKNVKDAEDGPVLDNIEANRKRMDEAGYRTPGEMYARDERFATRDERFPARKRNTTDSYLNTVSRDLLEQEIHTLFQRQRELGSAFASPELEHGIVQVFAWQKPFASGDDIIRLVGTCTFEDGEIRAPKHAYHAERCSLLQAVNKLTYSTNGDKARLDERQRKTVVDMAYARPKVTYAQIRKAIGLPEDARFSGLTYLSRQSKAGELTEDPKCESATFFELKGYHTLRKAFSGDGLWERVSNNHDLMDDLAYALTFYKTDEDIQAYLAGRAAPELLEPAQTCAFTKTANLSLVAIKNILPHLENGMLYNEACAAAGYNHTGKGGGHKTEKLPPIPTDLIRNPVVLRALTQTRKVVNGVISRYGSPYEIHIELARDVGRSYEDRRKTEKQQQENRKQREERERRFREEFNREPVSADLLKWRLYAEQSGRCAYSLKPLDLDRLFEPDYAEVDHIIPRSRSFDDSLSNKALVLTDANRNKKNRTPHEWFGHDAARWAEYEAWVRGAIRDPRKRGNLLKENYDARQEEERKERCLVDTRYASSAFASFVRDNLLFADPSHKLPVRCLNGQVTAWVRALWGLHKDRQDSDLHHAQDAAVIAAVMPHQVEMLTRYAQVVETREPVVDTETGEIIEWKENQRPRLPYPWKGFRREVLDKTGEVVVSRMPLRKTGGALHKDTLRSSKHQAENRTKVRKPLAELSAADLPNLVALDEDRKLYAAIERRMAEFDNDAAKAFAQPLYKPLKDGSNGPVVKTVKVWQTLGVGVPVRKGMADNASMIRIDVFRKQNNKGKWQYYVVPIYVAHVMSGKLPDMSADHEFLFSIHPYDLVRVAGADWSMLGYFRGYNVNTNSLELCEPNNVRSCKGSIGARNLLCFEKFEMGVLGDYYPVRKETRRGLANDSDLEPGEAEG